MEPWVSLVSTFTLAGVALFVAFCGPWIIEKWKYSFYVPKLEIEFELARPYCQSAITEDGGVHYCFNFCVGNKKGRLRADECEAILEKVWKKDKKGEWREWQDFRPINLVWSGEDAEMGFQRACLKNIHPGRERVFCGLGWIYEPEYPVRSEYIGITTEQEQQNKFFFDAAKRVYSQWDCLVPGNYKLAVSIYSKNAPRETRTFNINWTGEWKDTEKEMFKEIVIW